MDVFLGFLATGCRCAGGSQQLAFLLSARDNAPWRGGVLGAKSQSGEVGSLDFAFPVWVTNSLLLLVAMHLLLVASCYVCRRNEKDHCESNFSCEPSLGWIPSFLQDPGRTTRIPGEGACGTLLDQ